MIPLDLRDIHVKVHHQWRFQKTDHFPAAFLSSCCLTFLSYIAIKNGIFSDTLLSILRKIFYFIISNRPKCLRFKHASISWPHRENILIFVSSKCDQQLKVLQILFLKIWPWRISPQNFLYIRNCFYSFFFNNETRLKFDQARNITGL